MSSRALHYLTHVTVGPLLEHSKRGPVEVSDPNVQTLGRSIGFIRRKCPLIEVLGVHVLASDIRLLPRSGLEPVSEAIADAAMHCATLNRIIIGLSKLAFTTIELAVLPEVKREDKVKDWVVMVLTKIQLVIDGIPFKDQNGPDQQLSDGDDLEEE